MLCIRKSCHSKQEKQTGSLLTPASSFEIAPTTPPQLCHAPIVREFRCATTYIPASQTTAASNGFATPREAEPMTALPLDRIFPNPDYPRKEFSERKLKELAQSIRKE